MTLDPNSPQVFASQSMGRPLDIAIFPGGFNRGPYVRIFFKVV